MINNYQKSIHLGLRMRYTSFPANSGPVHDENVFLAKDGARISIHPSLTESETEKVYRNSTSFYSFYVMIINYEFSA